MAVIHHLELVREVDVPDAHVAILAESGWTEGPLPDHLRPPPDPRFVPAQPAPPEPVDDELEAPFAEHLAASATLDDDDPEPTTPDNED